MRTKLLFTCFLLITFTGTKLQAQDTSLLKMLNDAISANAKPMYVTGTFKALHLVNMQTVEGPANGVLYFEIQHRFGALNSGSYNFFGLDNANLRLGLDYGISDRLAVGIGRSSLAKTFDGYLKYKLFRQTDASEAMPISVSLLGTISNYTLHNLDKPYLNAKYRTAYTGQLLLAKKFASFSIELTPTLLHYNLVPTPQDHNNIFALGIGGRIKLSNRMSLIGEYNYVPTGQLLTTGLHNSMSLAWEIETGGHVFQLVFSNSQSMIESQYIGQTTGSWGKGDIYFGFNISRVFNVKKHK